MLLVGPSEGQRGGDLKIPAAHHDAVAGEDEDLKPKSPGEYRGDRHRYRQQFTPAGFPGRRFTTYNLRGFPGRTRRCHGFPGSIPGNSHQAANRSAD